MSEVKTDILLFFGTIAVMLMCGCATQPRSFEADGVLATDTGTLAIGSIDVVAAPIGEETATIRYEDDTSWFSSDKTHKVKIVLTGTNAVSYAQSIVKEICAAFIKVAPQVVE